MLEAVFKGHTTFIAIAVLMTAAVGAVAFAAARRRSDRPTLLALWAASISGTLFLTLWTTGGSQMAPTCLINKDILEPFTELQGRLNAALFLPVGLLGTLVTRRPLPAVAAGAALSALIETVQGALPALGRACDTSDLVANSLGAAAGAAAGYLLIKVLPGRLRPWQTRPKPAVFGALAFVITLTTVFTTVITPRTAARASANGPANSAQTAAARDAVRQAFGSYYAIRNVQFTASPEDASGTVFVALSTGYLQLSWPDRTQVTASIDDSDTGPESGFPVTGVLGPLHDQQQAIATATLYARRHYPWGPRNARAQAEPVGPGGSLGWLVSWRRYRDGVLMPMRLDIQVDHAGRISQLAARAIADPNVPHPTVTRPTAADAAAHAAPGCGRPQVGELLAVQTKGTWRPVWRVVMTCTASSTVVNVDAVTAKVESEQHYGAAPPTADAGSGN